MGFLFPSKWNTQLYVLSNICSDISSLYLAEYIWPLILKTKILTQLVSFYPRINDQ